jgi:hypothetical protein
MLHIRLCPTSGNAPLPVTLYWCAWSAFRSCSISCQISNPFMILIRSLSTSSHAPHIKCSTSVHAYIRSCFSVVTWLSRGEETWPTCCHRYHGRKEYCGRYTIRQVNNYFFLIKLSFYILSTYLLFFSFPLLLSCYSAGYFPVFFNFSVVFCYFTWKFSFCCISFAKWTILT